MPAPPARKIDFIPGLREKRIGDRVVLERKMSEEQHAEFVDAIRRFDFDVIGHYSRPDVLRLVANKSPQTGVAVQAAVEVPVREGQRT